MGKFSSVVLGLVSGAAAAVFLTSKKGKEVTEKVTHFVKEAQEDPESVKESFVQSATDLSNQVVTRIQDVKEKVENGEITTESVLESVKDTTQEVVNYSQEKISQLKESFLATEVGKVVTEEESSEDIIIDLSTPETLELEETEVQTENE